MNGACARRVEPGTAEASVAGAANYPRRKGKEGAWVFRREKLVNHRLYLAIFTFVWILDEKNVVSAMRN